MFAWGGNIYAMTTYIDDDGRVFPTWSLGDHIRKARNTVGMDQRQFAEQLGVKSGSLAAWETDRQRPRDVVAIAKRIELLTHIPAGWILGVEQENPRPIGPDGGNAVRHQGLEPRTRCHEGTAGQRPRVIRFPAPMREAA